MKKNKLKFCATFLLICCLSLGYAQEVITAAGGEASGNGGMASYSVGQLVYTTSSGAGGSVSEGIQQGYDISVVSGLEDVKDIHLILAYPNPTIDFLTLKIDNHTDANLSYQLFTISGKILEKKNITANETIIAMVHLAPATYFLNLTTNNVIVKTFKIIKF